MCVGGGLGMMVQSGLGLNRDGFRWDVTFLGGPGSGLCGGGKKSLSLCIWDRRAETLVV
jgi:hypothetical protein